jgi:hypothetical protein
MVRDLAEVGKTLGLGSTGARRLRYRSSGGGFAMRWLVLLMLLLVTAQSVTAETPTASKFCASMDEGAARASSECVRWYFACRLTFPAGPAKPPFDRITVEERYQISLNAILRLAETGCDHFSYVEAWAAMQAKSIPKIPAPISAR